MKIIKKIDIFILKSYLLLFAGTFFICLFIFMMQFMWRYVEELIGKGLPAETVAKFFYYSGLTLVPVSLPLAILLASLITFGNLGEKFELLSMKAAGIPLVRILQPVFFFVLFVCAGSFYFQNVIGPEATKQLATLVWSMKQKSPELEIPEGIFYSEIPGYNLFVEHKDKETGMLYGVIIYSTTNGYADAQIVLADSARLQSTADKLYLKLTLYNGERFRNMDSQGGDNMFRASVPYMRESFISEVDLIPFDGNFNLMDANLFSGNAQTKDLHEILHSIDSLQHDLDSVGHYVAGNTLRNYLRKSLPEGIKDSLQIVAKERENKAVLDSLYGGMADEQKVSAWKNALTRAQTTQSEYDYRSFGTSNMNESLRKHKIEAHKKFTMSLACLLFFFVGAPLGAIIRKGGLGVSVVISVVIFIFWYMANVGSEKMAKTGEWNIVSGVWLSSAILFVVGMFLVNRANKDSVVFNIEGYRAFFQRLLGLRMSRRINRKEVVLNDPDYPVLTDKLLRLTSDCRLYTKYARLYRIPNYWTLFFQYREDHVAIDLNDRLEAIVDELHNTRDNVILARLNDLPILVPDAHTRPFHNRRRNMAVGIFLPLGLFFWLRIWRYRLRLWHDMQQIQKLCLQIRERIIKLHIPTEQ